MNDEPQVIILEDSPALGGLWDPIVGRETERFLDGKPSDMAARLSSESRRILEQCVPPNSPVGPESRRSGLIIGYVQSGKTSSFTTVTAMARDNGFKFIVVIAGTTEILQKQTVDRLKSDLGLNQLNVFNRWSLHVNPSTDPGGDALKNLLQQHARKSDYDQGIPLVVVMKQHVHLKNLIALLGDVQGMDKIPALVIDDESHMYSPNVGKGGRESATYSQLRQLRNTLPVHTLLQYTATPQAPLLAEICDELSPDFVRLLEPGPGYTGGEYFFVQNNDSFVRIIPNDETYALDPGQFEDKGPPASLRRALLTFLVACAVERISERESGSLENLSHRSLLIHPQVAKASHEQWHTAVQAMATSVKNLLLEPDGDPDRQAFISDEIEAVRLDLGTSLVSIPNSEHLVPEILSILGVLRFQKINADNSGSIVEWPQNRYWVLTGGNLLGVGFTVEGLVVTHMMRATGTNLMDSIQQRARFFGYKAKYAPMCRAWIQSSLSDSFVDYVRHETALRKSLREFDEKGRPLKEWKRYFLLDPRFKLTRKGAQRISLSALNLHRGDGWVIQRHFDGEATDLMSRNRSLVYELFESLNLEPAIALSGNTPATTHRISSCDITLLRNFLASYEFLGLDSTRMSAIQLFLAMLADNSEQPKCSIIEIAHGYQPGRSRTLEAGDPAAVAGGVVVHQGRGKSGERYRGDKAARVDGNLSLQIHLINVERKGHGVLARDVPFLALFVPESYRTGMVYEV